MELSYLLMCGGPVRIGDENPHPHGSRFWFSWKARMKQMTDAKKSREELERRSGMKKFYEVLGRMIYRAYPYGRIFDIHTGELVVFSERPGLFIQAAIREAEKSRHEWNKKTER